MVETKLKSEIKRINTEGIKGDVVECGVYKGLSMQVFLKEHLSMMDNALHRTFYLFDTYEGMPQRNPDLDWKFKEKRKDDGFWTKARPLGSWLKVPLEVVKQNINNVLQEFPEWEKKASIKYIKGLIEDTLSVPDNLPEKIAFLNLDTDFYKSTLKSLQVLEPRVVPSGVLIVDDYGTWNGAKEATLEYFIDRPPHRDTLDRRIYLGKEAFKDNKNEKKIE